MNRRNGLVFRGFNSIAPYSEGPENIFRCFQNIYAALALFFIEVFGLAKRLLIGLYNRDHKNQTGNQEERTADDR